MFESRDILNYTLAAAVTVLTFFTAWILWYVVSIFREFQKLTRDVTGAIEKFNGVLDFAKEKISTAASVLPLVAKGIEKVIDMVGSAREKAASRKKAKRARSDDEADGE